MRARVLSIAVLALVAGCGSNNGGTDSGTGGTDSGMDAGSMACTMTGAEDTAAACGNGCDDDGDTFADCNDFDCCGAVTCGPTTQCGMRGDGGTPPARCDGGTGMENTAEACMNGCDDDGDGFADCRDFDCPASACPRDGGMTACAERGDENTVEACTNGCDDNGNGFFDCGDFGCCLVLQAAGMACTTGACRMYMPRDMDSELCAGDDVTMPPGREATLAACSDGCDNDRNSYGDCSDRGCCLIRSAGGAACTGSTFCATMFMPGTVNLCDGDDVTEAPGTEADATACGNMCDDDRDGFEDCDDRDCCEVRMDCPASTFCGRP